MFIFVNIAFLVFTRKYRSNSIFREGTHKPRSRFDRVIWVDSRTRSDFDREVVILDFEHSIVLGIHMHILQECLVLKPFLGSLGWF